VGDPGGSCRDCPLARFGSATKPDGSKGGGQACRDQREVLLRLDGDILPHLLIVPPTSIDNFDRYKLSLFSSGLECCEVVTEISLEKVRRVGYDCTRLGFRLEDRLNEEERDIFAPYHARMQKALLSSAIEVTAHGVENNGPITIASAPRQLQPNSDSEVPF
jgi:hypothetical protein